ncbi:hypothetical protein EVAR_64776_1 [Eumeta japonica]|uniref:Uncharacterized protein n=1 Tax=Eumeta variegata TaxID=151549 RepID=A0A4C1ZS36_EUMVA|nr:hypothetical protein EVAR_64776_1 [Eumeta japonica]
MSCNILRLVATAHLPLLRRYRVTRSVWAASCGSPGLRYHTHSRRLPLAMLNKPKILAHMSQGARCKDQTAMRYNIPGGRGAFITRRPTFRDRPSLPTPNPAAPSPLILPVLADWIFEITNSCFGVLYRTYGAPAPKEKYQRGGNKSRLGYLYGPERAQRAQRGRGRAVMDESFADDGRVGLMRAARAADARTRKSNFPLYGPGTTRPLLEPRGRAVFSFSADLILLFGFSCRHAASPTFRVDIFS